jgi:hypothetical protein
MFMTTFVTSIVSFYEIATHTPLARWLSVNQRNLLISILATFSIAWEQPHRRVDISYYVAPRTFEIFWNMLKNRKIVSDFPGQNVSPKAPNYDTGIFDRDGDWYGRLQVCRRGHQTAKGPSGRQTDRPALTIC